MSAAPKLATAADIAALPEHLIGEIIAAELYVSPRPGLPHAGASSVLGGELYLPFFRGRGGPGGWWILDEPELHLDDDVLVPDLAGWRRERMPTLPRTAAISLAPDWLCEVLSPSTARLDRSLKMDVYARSGVKWAWLLDPDARTLEAYRLIESGWLRVGAWADHAVVRVEPFAEVPLELAVLWGEETEAKA